jgi:hypothetical protein
MALFRRAMTAIMGTEEAIAPALLARYPELSIARIRRGGIPPRIGGWCLGCSTVAGITFGRTVWLGRDTRLSAELLLHEVCHVRQFEAVPAFPLRYILESLRRGYHHNRFEVDARRFARERALGHSGTPQSEDV